MARQQKEIFTRGEHDTWNGVIEHFGKCNFQVVGTYGAKCDPIITVNRSEHMVCESAAIEWKTGKVLRFFGQPSGEVDCIE